MVKEKGKDYRGVEVLVTQLKKAYGQSAVMTLAKDMRASITHHTSTGAYDLDDATSWGLPGGRIVEFFGPESSGKTTAAMAAMVENERRGGINMVVDAEGTFDSDRYKQMGGDPEQVLSVEVSDLETFYDQLKSIMAWAEKQDDIPSNAVILIVVDTITTVQPRAVLQLKDDEELMASQARVNSRHLPTVDQNMPGNTCLLLLSQVRDKMGAAAWNVDGNIDTPGGHVLKHHASIRVLFKNAGQLDNGKSKEARRIVGIKTAFKVVKNKVGPPHRKGTFNIMFDSRGVDNVAAFLQRLVENGVVKKGTAGVFSLIYKDKEVKFKAGGFAALLQKIPKWTQKQLDSVFTVKQPGLALDRHLAVVSPDSGEQEDDDA